MRWIILERSGGFSGEAAGDGCLPKETVMDIATKALAVKYVLLDVEEAAGRNDKAAAQQCRALVKGIALGFSAERRTALERVFEVSGKWVRDSDGTATAEAVRESAKGAIAIMDEFLTVLPPK
jgi:hypothetical protein